MKKLICIFVLILFSILANQCFALTGKVIKVADGDTITILTADKQQVKIRLYGIDCPERKMPFGNVARQAATQMVAGKTVNIEVESQDRYGRTVGLVILPNGLVVNKELINLGLAWVYPQFCKKPYCREWQSIEQSARSARRGLWVDKNPEPPWTWRKRKK